MRPLYALLLLIAACGQNDSPVAPPTEQPTSYRLTTLLFEDVVPGEYAVTLSDSTMRGGPATLTFNASTGTLTVPTTVEARLDADPDSLSPGYVTVLPAGTVNFTYTLDTARVVTLSIPAWFNGGVLSAESYRGDHLQCYDPECTNYTALRFVWTRQ